MQLIRNTYSGKVHILMRNQKNTLCGTVKNIRVRMDAYHPEYRDWEVLIRDCNVSRAIRATDCKLCLKLIGGDQ